MSKMTFATKWAITSQLPLIANPGFPVGGLVVAVAIVVVVVIVVVAVVVVGGSGGGGIVIAIVGSVVCSTRRTTIPSRPQTYSHTLPILGLLIMKKCATITIRTPFFSIKLLTMSSFIRPWCLNNKS
uniref:Transmembrane protein n=1 Tax=Cannabis sativa TaxID=3483 RepID=A0A803R618_CANSA